MADPSSAHLRRLGRVLPLLVVAALAAPASAGAAAQVGQIAPADPDISCQAESSIAQRKTSLSANYFIPVGGGVITRWKHRGDAVGPGSGRLQVWRPPEAEGSDEFRLIGRSAVETFDLGVVNEFETRIPVIAGTVLGLRATTPMAGCAFTAPIIGADVMTSSAVDTDPLPGDNRLLFSNPAVAYRVNVVATLEPDADSDGFGDETQDACPTDRVTQAPCPAPADTDPPETKITKKPKRKIKTTKRTAKVKVAFKSEEGAKFKCKLDKARYKSCSSPYNVKLKSKPGKGMGHTISVKAIDGAGNIGRAARVKIKVIRKG